MSRPIRSSFDAEGDVEVVFAVLTGEGWAALKAEQLQDGSRQESREVGADGSLTLVMSRALPDGIPGFLEKFLPAEGRATTTDVWGEASGGSRHGTWTAVIPGTPAKIAGTMRIEPLDEGCRYTIEGQAKVAVPILGGKAESFIAGMVMSIVQREADVVATLL